MWWITAGCLLAKGIWSHLKVTRALVDVWQASETSHSKSSQGNFQPQYWPELLVNVYSYRLMVKSVSCCCVCGRHLFSNPVTITGIIMYIIATLSVYHSCAYMYTSKLTCLIMQIEFAVVYWVVNTCTYCYIYIGYLLSKDKNQSVHLSAFLGRLTPDW